MSPTNQGFKLRDSRGLFRRGKSQKRISVERDVSSPIASSSVPIKKENEFLKQSGKTVNVDKEIPLVGLESNSIKSDVVSSLINEECILTNVKLEHEQWEFESASSITSRNTINNSQSFIMNKNGFLPKRKKSASEFWSFVKPFLAHVKKRDLDWLEDFVESYDSNNNVYEIPPLGEHYADNWTQEKLEIEKEQLCSQSETNTKLFEQLASDMAELVSKVGYAGHNDDRFAPIYRRVISTLKILWGQNSSEEHDNHKGKSQEISKVRKEFYTEQNFKKQLYKLDVITKPMLSPLTDSDEVLEEIIKCKSELEKLQKRNKNQLTDLLKKCRDDNDQQIIKNTCNQLDKKILNFGKQQSYSLQKGETKTHDQYLEENHELRSLLDQRNDCLKQLQQPRVLFEPNDSSISSFDLNSSKSRDLEPDAFIEHLRK